MMRYWVHATLTIVLSVVGVVAGLIFMVVVGISLPFDAPAWFRHAVMLVGLVAGLFLPTLVMSRIPCACPKCGGKAKYGFAAWGNGFTPTFAWSCQSCQWSTYRWSAYQQALRTRRIG
jgi:hypothetical protein